MQWNLLTLCPMRCCRRIGSLMFTVQVNLSQRTPWSYVEDKDIALRIFNLGFRWEWTVILIALPRVTSPRYLMYRSLGRHQSLPWRLWRTEDLAYAGNQTADPRSSSPYPSPYTNVLMSSSVLIRKATSSYLDIDISWSSSVPPIRCLNTTSNRPQPLPSSRFF
jgi:hypothetical protein